MAPAGLIFTISCSHDWMNLSDWTFTDHHSERRCCVHRRAAILAEGGLHDMRSMSAGTCDSNRHAQDTYARFN